MDTSTSASSAVDFAPSPDGDSPALPDPQDQIPEDEHIGAVTAGGTCAARPCRSAIVAAGGTAIPPNRCCARPWKAGCPAASARNEAQCATRPCGRALWQRFAGYHPCSRAEARMPLPVTLEPISHRWCDLETFVERIAARDPDRQTAGIRIRVALMNRFGALGTAEIVRVAGA